MPILVIKDSEIGSLLREWLRGKHTHVDPLKAVKGLSFEMANKRPGKDVHSCRELLYHIVYWQDLMLSALRGEDVKWPEDFSLGWPLPSKINTELKWKKLVNNFCKGVEEAETLSQKKRLTETLPSWKYVNSIGALGILALHNSYHIGQLVTVRQSLKQWPPPE